MNKRDLTEQEIRSRYIRPALIDAGWEPAQIREEYYFTAGRMHISGQTAVRGKRILFLVDFIEEAADGKTMRKALQLEPLNEVGTPMEIVRAFGGRLAYTRAIRQLEQQIYQVN